MMEKMKKLLPAVAAALLMQAGAQAQNWRDVQKLYKSGMYSEAVQLLGNSGDPQADAYRALCALGMRSEGAYALAGAFLAPFMLGLYWRGATPYSVWACFAWGVGLTVVNMLAGNPINPINCGAIAMIGGFVVVGVVSLMTPKMDRSRVDQIFKCYQ